MFSSKKKTKDNLTKKTKENINTVPREKEELPSTQEAYLGTLYLTDDIKAPDNMVYGWIAETINGVDAINNVQDAYRRGWRPVPASRHPQASYPGIGEIFKGMDTSFIKRKGQILMERPRELHEQEIRLQNEKTQQLNQLSNWARPETQDPRMPNVNFVNDSRFQSIGK